MNEETFNQIHGETGGAISIGIDQIETVNRDIAATTVVSSGSLQQGDGSYTCSVTPSYPLPSASFFVYWDPEAECFKMNAPIVYVNGLSANVEDSDSLSEGTYYCNVTEDPPEEGMKTTYTAKIQDYEDSDAVRSVKICEISNGQVSQFHVGTLSFSIVGPYLFVGKSDSAKGYIELDAKGEEPKLTLTTIGGSSITLDIAEIPGDCKTMKLGIKRIKWNTTTTSEDGVTTTEEKHSDVIACDDIDLTGLGGGGGDKDVVTSIVVGENGTALKGDVVLEADPAIVGIYAVADGQKIRFDVNGRADDESLIVRDVVDMSEKDEVSGEFGKIVSRVFATENFTINKGGDVTFVGTDGTTEATCKAGKKITFATAEDSNVVVTPSADEDGNVTLTIGVYYK